MNLETDFKIEMSLFLLLLFYVQKALSQTFPTQSPPNFIAIDRIVHIYGKGHKLPSCFGTLLSKRHVITSATCLLDLSDGIVSKKKTSDALNGLSKVHMYASLDK